MEADDLALVYYTSGTTGSPKGVMLSHGAIAFSAGMFSSHLGFSPRDRSLVTGSLAFFYHSVINGLTALSSGATLVLLDRFHPELAARAVEKHRVTVVMAVPTAYVMILNWVADNRYDFSSLRFALTAGAAFPAALYNRIRTVLGIRIFDCWGMTECAPLTSYNPQVDKNGKPDSCGKPLPNCSVRIVDPMFNEVPLGEIGEVLLKSPAIMEGYYKNPKATDEAIVDGWVRSGDLGRLDAEGYLFIVGRRKDMIIRGGANIYSVDIEQVLYEHQAVAECAVIGVPDQVYSERVRAFVVLKDGVTGPS